MNNDLIRIVSQAFYGNRTETEVERKNIDRFVLGYLDASIPIDKEIDRTIVRVSNADNIVIVYNKYQEEEARKKSLKPLAVIPKGNIEIYSRCIVCRVNESGELESLQDGDYEKFVEYLTE
jgi:hypothetical protein